MRYSYPLPARAEVAALHRHLAALGLPGFTGVSLDGKRVHIELGERADDLTPEEAQALEAAVASYVYQEPADAYRQKRAAEYPPIGDQLDAIWKALTPPAGSEAEAMKAAILAVKARHPKSKAAQ